MTRVLITVNGKSDRERAARWAMAAPYGMRIEYKQSKRTTDQNALFWSLLTSIATQKQHCGQKYSTDIWKCIMMHAWGREVKFIPALDGNGVIPLLFSSSDLSKQEMTDLIEFMLSWGAQNGVIFHDDEKEHAA